MKDSWWWLIAIALVVVVIGLSAWALVTIPNQIVASTFKEYRDNNVAIEQRALVSASADARQAVTLAIGGIIALITFVLSLAKHRLSKQEHSLDQQKQRLENEKYERERDSLWANRYTEALAQFTNRQSGSIRLGGIYSLERTAQESENDRQPILEVLCAYLRENCRSTHLEEEGTESPLNPDFEITKTVREVVARILKMSPATRVDLSHVDLSGLDLEQVFLEGASLRGVDLSGANLSGAILNEASLENATFQRAKLNDAKLNGAFLNDADFSKTSMRSASLKQAVALSAIFDKADLREASLEAANLTNANFVEAKLIEASLELTTLDGAFFIEADLTNASFKKSKINGTDFERSFVFKSAYEMNLRSNRDNASSTIIFGRQPDTKTRSLNKNKMYADIFFFPQPEPEAPCLLTMNDLSEATFEEATPPKNV